MQQAVSEGFSLSPQQQHVWWAQQGEQSPAFVVQMRIDITGPLDRARLARALATVAQRHEILRTTFPRLPGLGVPVQAIVGSAVIDWREISLTGLYAHLREAALDRLSDDVQEIPFDLANGPLLRATLIGLDGERFSLLVTQPPLAADGPSLDLLAADVAAAYHGCLVGEVLQYADLAEILHEWQGSPAEEPGPSFWREQDLSALVRVTPSPAGLTCRQPFRIRRVRRTFGRAAIEEAATRLATTVPQVLLAGWLAAIHASTGEEELVVGVLFDGRTFEELRSALGPFARYLPVRGRVTAGSTLTELCGTLAATLADVERRQDFFSSESVERLLAQHGASGWPFGFDYRRPNEPPAVPCAPRFAIGDGYLGLDRFGLRLSVFDGGRSLRADLTYELALLGHDEAWRFLERLAYVLDGLIAGSPLGEIEILTEAERRELLAFNRTESAVSADLLAHQLFEERAHRAPDAPAVFHMGRTWTYGELNACANRLAYWMRASGLGSGSLVGLCLERSPELVATILGTLKAGAAYVPLDPSAPAERLAWMVEDAGLSLLLTRESLLPILAGEISLEDGQDPPPSADPADLVYVIYTSGSTGRPKGVMISHHSLVNYLLWARETYAADIGAGSPVHSAIGFDLTVTSLLVPLASGTTVTLLDERLAVEALAAALRETSGFSLVKLTPAHLDVLNGELARGELAGRARALVIGGEALRGESVAPWREHAPDTRLINEYGPTEATVGCCAHEIAPDDPQAGPVAIGHPIANMRLHVVGRGMQRVPPGVPGELWIGGDGLARGYLGRPALTAERFVPDLFAGEVGREGERLYRTGDLVRRRSDGRLEFLGRIDDQLKIRGFRIEPGEIEAELAVHPKVRECVVLARENERGKQLVACVVPRAPSERPLTAELRRYLEERLPDYMVPAVFIVLGSLPLTPNGKVDRRALLTYSLPEQEETPYTPPRTLAEEVLAEVWMQVLGLSRVGIDDPFFSLGGDSIRSLQVISLARKRGLAMTLQDLFQQPTIRRLAQAVRLDGATPEPELSPALYALISERDRERLGPGIEDAYPLARLQAGMLFHSELAPASAIYHDLHSFHVRAPFDPGRMREALSQVSLLHPVLRTSFDLAGFSEPLQLVRTGVIVPLEIHDLLHGTPEEQDALLAAWLGKERQRGFDWTCPPLVAFHAHPRGEGSFQLTLSFHHAILDGWSAATLLTDLFRRYALLLRGEEPPLDAPFEVTYRDFVALERAALASEDARSFWSRMLNEAETARLPRLAPSDRGPSAVHEIYRRIDPALSDAARQVARAAEVPLKSLLFALHLKVMGLFGGTRDVLTGLVAHGRPEHPDGERVLGLFLNTLPFRIRLREGSWRDLAREVFDLERRMLPYRRFPFAEMRTLRGGGRLELEIVYDYLHFHVYKATTDVNGIEVLGWHGYEETNFPLIVTLSLDPFSQALRLGLTCRMPELDPREAGRFADYLLRALEAAAADPESPHDAPLLSAAERQQLLREWNDTAFPAPDLRIHDLFAMQAARTPDAPAVWGCDGSLTYGELDRRSGELALRLRRLGASPEILVGLHLERSATMVVALLAVLKAGGAYLPLDPAWPRERLELMLADSGAGLLVTQSSIAGRLAFAGPTLRIDQEWESGGQLRDEEGALPDHLAYVIYTSGSTGTPKGVMVAHRSLVASTLARIGYYGDAPRGFLLLSSFAFDSSVAGIFGTLCAGGRLVVASNELLAEGPERLAELMAAEEVSHLLCVPSLWAYLVERPEAAALRGAIVAGEALQAKLVDRHFALLPGTRLWNEYGPTEGTVWSSVQELAPVPVQVTIGRPIGNSRLYVVDRELRPVPYGVAGELLVGGLGVTRGYLRRPDLTAERFAPDPFGGVPGARLYHTGDLARWLPDGSLDFLGRIDSQVKVRGFRIELGEIEAVLTALPGVSQAVVLVREDTPGNQWLVAYIVGDAAAPELRQVLRERLPEHMVPAAFVALSALPLTPNGKVDRKALPEPEGQSAPEASLAPRTPVEEILSCIWADVLSLERVGITDHFFELGGHSLLATRVMSRLRTVFGVEIPLRDLFEAPTVEGLAARIEAARRTGMQQLSPPLVPMPREGALPLSFAQQRLWFIDQLKPGSPLYNIPAALRVEGSLDAAVLALCLGEIVRRHEALRTVFAVRAGVPVQVIQPAEPFLLPVVDLSALPEGAREELTRTLTVAEAGRPFDLARGLLMRALLLRLAEMDHVAVLTMHHIASDGWSMGILIHEVSVLYAALSEGWPSPLPELPVQYADFALWQRSWLHGEILENEIAWWRRQLAGLPPLLQLPTDRPRPAVQSYRGAARSVRLPAGLTQKMEALARHEGVTLFMVLLAGFQVLLARYSGQDDLAVGSPIAGRNRAETEGLIGFFVNMLVLRGNLAGTPTFREVLGRVRETALAAYVHQDVPFEKLVEELAPERSLAHAPLFQVVFVLQNAPVASLQVENLRLRPIGVNATTAKFDVMFTLEEHDGELLGTIEYATDLYDATTIDRLLAGCERLLEAAATDPGSPHDEPLLSAVERQQLLWEWNDTEAAFPEETTLHGLVAAQAARTPSAVAVELGDERWSYRRLIDGARRLARRLRELGVRPDAIVGLCAERSPEMIVGMLAVLEAGGAYLPLDPTYPAQRLAFMLDDSEARVLLVQERLSERIPAADPRVTRVPLDARWIFGDEVEEPLGIEVMPDNLAYVIYTSGSTGRPKGVMVPHRGVCNRLRWAQEVYWLDKRDAVLQKASFGFDFSVWECFAPLAAGARLVLAEPGRQGEGPYLVRTLREHRVTFVHFVPSLLAVFLREEEVETCASLRQVFSGGEALTPDLRDRALARLAAPLDNQYGPTEVSIDTTRWVCAPGQEPDRVPIGRPIGNSRLYVVDPELRPVPYGVAGELLVGGLGVTRGYLRRPDLTAERFAPDPFGGVPGARLYRTGDLARWLPDGSLDFLGRIDSQVKVRGFRIELGEIEGVLTALPGVIQAVVVVREDTPGNQRLVAYIVGDAAAPELRQVLRERLPEHMVPAAFVALSALPLTPNGKVDRKALPAPEVRSPEETWVAPRTPAEEILAEIWAEVLGTERVGVRENFFDHGGHSLSAVLLMDRIRRRLGRTLPLAALFAAPTVEALAALLARPGTEAPEPRRPLLVALKPGGDRAPFFCVHPIGGNVLCYLDLARLLSPEQPFYALQMPDFEPSSLAERAGFYVRELRRAWPGGPYRLGGWSMGGLIAFEMARQMAEEGERPDLVALIDTLPPAPASEPAEAELMAWFAQDLGQILRRDQTSPARLRPFAGRETLGDTVRLAHAAGLLPEDVGLAQIEPLFAAFAANLRASRLYNPGPYPGRLVLWLSEQTLASAPDLPARWGRLALGGLETSTLAGDHYSLLRRPWVERLAGELMARLGG